MKADNQNSPQSRFTVTTQQGEEIDLTKAKEIRSNNLYPFGRHNYAIYHHPEGLYVKGTNTDSAEYMLDTYVLIPEAEALAYRHPFVRQED